MVEEKKLPTNTEINVNQLPSDMPGTPKGGFKLPFLNKKSLLLLIPIFLVIALAAFLLLRTSDQDKKVMSLSYYADQAFQKGDYGTAQKYLTSALKIKKNDPALLASTVKIIASKGNYTGREDSTFEETKPYIDQALKAGPNDPDVLISVGYAYETAGEYQKAFEFYDKATKVDPNSSDAWFHRGHVQEFLGKKAGAQKDYDTAHKLDSNSPLVLMVKGNRLLSEGKQQEAFESFLKASKTPNINLQIKSEALTAASIVRRNQDDYRYIREALELSRKAVEASPNFSPALAAHGYNLFLVKEEEDGIDHLKKSIKANPRISRNYHTLSLLYRGKKDFIKAVNYNKEAIFGAESDNTLLTSGARQVVKGRYTYDLAKTYSLSGLEVDIVPLLEEAIRLNPQLKSLVSDDFNKYGVFKELADNKSFINLLN